MFTLLCSANVASAEGVPAQYLQVHLPGLNRTLSLAEVEVYSRGRNVAPGTRATQSSTTGASAANKAIDGNTNGHFFEKSVTHTKTENDPWWELDLGKMHDVQKLIVFNREDCCSERLSPARVILLDANKNIVWQDKITDIRSRYVFEPVRHNKNTTPAGFNLLRNPTFESRTNPGLPDYWGVHDAVGRSVVDSFASYGLTESVLPPVPGAGVLVLENHDRAFKHLNIMPFKLHRKLINGHYVYSVYIKSSLPDKTLKIYQAWASGEPVVRRLSTEWTRYSFVFNYNQSRPADIQPVMLFPDTGTYYVSAPQLEQGTEPTVFNGVYAGEDAGSIVKNLKHNLYQNSKIIQDVLYRHGAEINKLFFEYDYYTDEHVARLIIRSSQIKNADVEVSCLSKSAGQPSVRISHKHQLIDEVMELPIKDFGYGRYTCDITVVDSHDHGKRLDEQLQLVKLKKSDLLVQQNSLNRQMYVNGKPFYLIGIAPGGGLTLPDWYLNDIRQQGINTLFLKIQPDSNHQYDISKLRSFLDRVSRYDLKIILGTPLSGVKAGSWQKSLLAFENVIMKLKDNTAIIGWYPLDEPAAYSWSDKEIMSIYSRIKQIDPYRPVLINWAYDGIPSVVGDEPRGTLSATDIYSMDYYPFQGMLHDMEGFNDISIRVFETATLKNKMSHSWLQLYGFSDVWREPTPQELTNMAYLNFIFGSSYSYWGARPSNALTWSALKSVNRQLDELSALLLFNPEATQVIRPRFENGFVYALWRVRDELYLIILNTMASVNIFQFDYSGYFPSGLGIKVEFLYENVKLESDTRILRSEIGAYDTKVVKIY